jgi:hypothetical protein
MERFEDDDNRKWQQQNDSVDWQLFEWITRKQLTPEILWNCKSSSSTCQYSFIDLFIVNSSDICFYFETPRKKLLLWPRFDNVKSVIPPKFDHQMCRLSSLHRNSRDFPMRLLSVLLTYTLSIRQRLLSQLVFLSHTSFILEFLVLSCLIDCLLLCFLGNLQKKQLRTTKRRKSSE